MALALQVLMPCDPTQPNRVEDDGHMYNTDLLTSTSNEISHSTLEWKTPSRNLASEPGRTSISGAKLPPTAQRQSQGVPENDQKLFEKSNRGSFPRPGNKAMSTLLSQHASTYNVWHQSYEAQTDKYHHAKCRVTL